jgi:hypothetical protein
MTVEQNKQVALQFLRVIETGDSSRWLSGTFSDLRFDQHEVVAEDERAAASSSACDIGWRHYDPGRK